MEDSGSGGIKNWGLDSGARQEADTKLGEKKKPLFVSPSLCGLQLGALWAPPSVTPLSTATIVAYDHCP